MEEEFVDLTLHRKEDFSIGGVIECRKGNSPCEPTFDGLEILIREEIIKFLRDYNEFYGSCSCSDIPDVKVMAERNIESCLETVVDPIYDDGKRHYFVVKLYPRTGELGHFITLLREDSNVYILDYSDLSFVDKSFCKIKKYLKEHSCKVFRMNTQLQYNSLACETFSYKMPFLFERCIAFNKGYKKFSDFLKISKYNNKVEFLDNSVFLLLSEKYFVGSDDIVNRLRNRASKYRDDYLLYSRNVMMVDELTKYDELDIARYNIMAIHTRKNLYSTSASERQNIIASVGGYMHNTSMVECADLMRDGSKKRVVEKSKFASRIADLDREIRELVR